MLAGRGEGRLWNASVLLEEGQWAVRFGGSPWGQRSLPLLSPFSLSPASGNLQDSFLGAAAILEALGHADSAESCFSVTGEVAFSSWGPL